jgi:hypothetical protein
MMKDVVGVNRFDLARPMAASWKNAKRTVVGLGSGQDTGQDVGKLTEQLGTSDL